MRRVLVGMSLLFSSCSYHVVDHSDVATVGIPFITGDKDGCFTKLLAQEIATSGIVEYKSRDTRYQLRITLDSEAAERIGFRYDRRADGTLKTNIIGTETRKVANATVELVDMLTDKIVFGPKVFAAHGDFDYVDSDNITDMSFINPLGERVLVFNYSLGQLNVIEGATDTAMPSIYRILSKKITDELAFYFKDH
jgi:hypothetical protein